MIADIVVTLSGSLFEWIFSGIVVVVGLVLIYTGGKG